MMNVTVSIPDGLADQLAKSGRSIENQLMVDLALHYYQLGVISLGKAAELSGLRRAEFENLLAEYRIERPGSQEHLRTDLDWASKSD
jgi:predicted HTH domain antitoxin